MKSQNISGSVSPMAQWVFDELRKSGTPIWLGPPPPEDMERLRQEKDERDLQVMKNRAEAKDRRREELQKGARASIRRNRDEQV